MENSEFEYNEKNGIIRVCSPDMLGSSKSKSGIIIEVSDTYINSFPNDMELGNNIRKILMDLLILKKSSEIKSND
jgi:hypothetical protein